MNSKHTLQETKAEKFLELLFDGKSRDMPIHTGQTWRLAKNNVAREHTDISFSKNMKSSSQPKITRVGVACVAQNTQRTELTLMFEKLALWFNFWYKVSKNKIRTGSRVHYLPIW